MFSGATNFTKTTRFEVTSTVSFPEFIYSQNRSSKINKTSMLSSNLISTGCFTRFLDLKFLPKPRHKLNIFHKNYQALYHQDKLVMQLTYHELA